MTDSQPTSHQPPPTSTHSGAHQGHSYNGYDPDLPEEKHAGRISTVQVGASAAAAVTSALAASFFGVAGTLIGAAIGSIVSTIAGALYADYLRRAGSRLRDTRTIVVQRLPAEALTTPLRHLTGPFSQQTGTPPGIGSGADSGTHVDPGDPAAVPAQASLQPVQQDGQETIAVPLATPEQIAQNSTPDPFTVLSAQALGETQLMPRITADTVTRSAATPAASGPTAGAASGGPGTGVDSDSEQRPWWKRPPLLLTGIGVAGFLIAVVVVTVIELGLGHPVSGGGSGTSISRAVEGKTGSSTSRPTPTVTVTLTPSATVSTATATATSTPTATTAPTPTATSTDTSTSTPDATVTTQPTSTTQATSTAGDIVPVATGTP